MIDAYSPGSASAFIGENSGSSTRSREKCSPTRTSTRRAAMPMRSRRRRWTNSRPRATTSMTTQTSPTSSGAVTVISSPELYRNNERAGSRFLGKTWYSDNFNHLQVVARRARSQSRLRARRLDRMWQRQALQGFARNGWHRQGIRRETGSTPWEAAAVPAEQRGAPASCTSATRGTCPSAKMHGRRLAVFRLSPAEGELHGRPQPAHPNRRGEQLLLSQSFASRAPASFSGVDGESRVLLNVSNDPPAGKGRRRICWTPPRRPAPSPMPGSRWAPPTILPREREHRGAVDREHRHPGDHARGAGAKCRGSASTTLRQRGCSRRYLR